MLLFMQSFGYPSKTTQRANLARSIARMWQDAGRQLNAPTSANNANNYAFSDTRDATLTLEDFRTAGYRMAS
jgi:hypothetical protein